MALGPAAELVGGEAGGGGRGVAELGIGLSGAGTLRRDDEGGVRAGVAELAGDGVEPGSVAVDEAALLDGQDPD